MKTKYILPFLVSVAFFYGCDNTDDLIDERLAENPVITDPDPTGDKGGTDFSNYVAIGNSLTAGLMGNALFTDGQNNSFPNILATQLKYADGGDFNQPDIDSEVGCSNITGGCTAGRLILNTAIPGPEPVGAGDTSPFLPYSGDKSALNNFGVPGIILGQLLTPATGGPVEGNPAYNPYYARFASDPSTDGTTGSTILSDVIATDPSFLTLWIGSNDVLGYAVSGASDEGIFTSAEDFSTQYNAVISSLMTNTTADGVVMNIPVAISALPFFRSVPYNAVPLDATTAATLNAALGGVNDALDGLAANMLLSAEDAAIRKINYTEGQNPVLIFDEDLEDLGSKFDVLLEAGAITVEERTALEPYEQSRPATAADLFTLTSATVIGSELIEGNPATTLGVAVPLEDQYTLTPEEQLAIGTRATEFNAIIEMAVDAQSDRLTLVDANTIFNDLVGADGSALGYEVDGQTILPDFSPNGFYSADGVHPNPRGHAIIANAVIAAIETKFNAEIPEADVLSFRSVIFK